MIKSANNASTNDLARLEASASATASWQNAQQYLLKGRHAPALTSYRNLVQQFPGVTQLWVELSIAAAGDLDFTLANQACKRAAELAVTDADSLVSIGQQYHRLRNPQQTGVCFENAVAADPASIHARLSLAAWLERNGRLEDAWECIEACLAGHPRDGHALYFKAFLLHRRGLDGEAETALRDLLTSRAPTPEVKYSASQLMGVVMDAVGEYAKAMDWLVEAKTLLRDMADTATLEATYDKMDHARREVLAALTPETVQRWREEAAALPSPHPLVFLGGLPHSSAAPIEQVLSAHPEIRMFDESESFVQELLNALHPKPPTRWLTFKSLDNLTASTRAQMIGRYFKSLMRETDAKPGGKLLLDKNPSLTASLHIWLRLFPQLKVIIGLRDPRDIIIDCYFQNLTLTAANVNFLSLERTAKFYSDSMDAWLRMRELGVFDWIEMRCEDKAGNLETEGKRVMNFLGLSWHENVAKLVLTQTSNEATKPAHNLAALRWEHYAEALAPLQADLAKYFLAFGYRW